MLEPNHEADLQLLDKHRCIIDLILQVSDIAQVLPLAKFIGVEGRIYASVNQANIGSCNGLSSVKRQAIIWTPAGSFLNASLGKKQWHFNQNTLDNFHTTINWKWHLKILSAAILVGPRCIMMTSSNGNIFRVTGPLCGEFTAHSPHKGQGRGALLFSLICALNKQLSKQSWGWWFETPSHSLWRHCNVDTCFGRLPV